jgi:adenylyltransferase/sulfurtransferase
MAVKIQLPTALRPYAGNQETIEVEGASVGEALDALAGMHSQLKRHLFEDGGRLRNFVNVYLNDDDIRHLSGPGTKLKPGDRLLIVPSIAGGSTSVALTAEEVQRYGRHLILPEVGLKGQHKLKTAKVLCVGAGGLGSPSTMYLAAAGVGTIGLVDFDVVEASNLQRQILHSTDSIGRSKLDSAKKTLKGINPNVDVRLHEVRLSRENALELFRGYDVVIDGTDNFATRYLVNDACVLLGKPNVYASIFRFDGQVSIFWAKKGPCYRCLYPEAPPPGLVPSCAEGGVLGALPGAVGTLQAIEAIKLIVGAGEPLIGRLLIFDALKMEFRRLNLKKDPDCPICGPKPKIRELVDYEAFCGLKQPVAAAGGSVPEISVEQLKKLLDDGKILQVLDVREPSEHEICRLPGSKLIPLGQLKERVHELDSSAELIVHCKGGGRSKKAVQLLRELGFEKAVNLAGGIDAWAQRVDPSVPRY